MHSSLELVEYTEEYRRQARELLVLRNMDPKLVNDLPELGYMVVQHHDIDFIDKSYIPVVVPVAMGFLRNVEGPYAMLDSYITNPHFSGEFRHHALDEITVKLLDRAKALGKTKILAFSAHKDIQERAEKFGLMPYPDHLFQVASLVKKD